MELLYTFDPERFYLGKTCKHGHTWPGTYLCLRRIYKSPTGKNVNHCVACTGSKKRDWLLSFLDYEEMGWPKNQTLGKLCPYGHSWNGMNASLRTWKKCVECQKTKSAEKSRLKPRKTNQRWDPELRKLPAAERRKEYKRKVRQALREQGLTCKGKSPLRANGAKPRDRNRDRQASGLQKAIRNAGRLPTVAKLVMVEQRRYWEENHEAHAQHRRQWRVELWRFKYLTNPVLRAYNREKSKRRKAQMRGGHAIKVTAAQLRQRFAQFGNTCAYCGTGGDLHIEHVVPISRGGTHTLGNVLPACQRCNYSKRAQDVSAWYLSQPFFSQPRWRRIGRVLGWGSGSPAQLTLL